MEQKYSHPLWWNLFVLSVTLLGTVVKTIDGQGPPPQVFDFMGATATKELYISHANWTNDYADAIASCRIRFMMNLLAVEDESELAIIDAYFQRTQGNVSDLAWTSLINIGDIGAHWSTGGSTFNGGIDAPWPAGGGGSPAYAWYKCATVRRTCARPPGSPDGCWPAYTGYLLTPCTSAQRIICQRPVQAIKI